MSTPYQRIALLYQYQPLSRQGIGNVYSPSTTRSHLDQLLSRRFHLVYSFRPSPESESTVAGNASLTTLHHKHINYHAPLTRTHAHDILSYHDSCFYDSASTPASADIWIGLDWELDWTRPMDRRTASTGAGAEGVLAAPSILGILFRELISMDLG